MNDNEMFAESSDDEEKEPLFEHQDLEMLSPFQFELHYNTKQWELLDAFFDKWLNRPSLPRHQINKVAMQVRKLRAFCRQVSQ
jgi:hypothetical protein